MKFFILLTLLVVLANPSFCSILITEVYYDQPNGADTDYEWVELLNTTSVPVDLTGYLLASGGTNYSFHVTILDFVIPACGTAVIGGSLSVPENGNPVYAQVALLNIQNSGSMSDAVAIFAPGSDVLTDCPLDTVIYGGSNTNGLLDETCSPGAVDAPDVSAGQSIERISANGNWAARISPDPNHIDFSFDCDGVVSVSEKSLDSVRALYR